MTKAEYGCDIEVRYSTDYYTTASQWLLRSMALRRTKSAEYCATISVGGETKPFGDRWMMDKERYFQ